MALKRQHDMVSLFSMASMTDVIFLLLIFFMVTSTFVFPTALEINLPESSEQTAVKPSTRIYIDQDLKLYVSMTDEEPLEVTPEQLLTFLKLNAEQIAAAQGAQGANSPGSTPAKPVEDFIAIYADSDVPYGKLVEVLDLGARNGLKMVLATKPAPSSAKPSPSNQ